MSAGSAVVDRDLGKLAPRFRLAVEAALEDCALTGLDAYIYEAYRSQELQALYYARGRTIIPPVKPVTNAQSNLESWHGYGLAVDVISRAHGWAPPNASWWEEIAGHFKTQGCKWGGDWKQVDLPHFQWGACKPSPSAKAREIIAQEGIAAVWEAVGAA